MIEPVISKEDLSTWAGYLLNHSLGGIEPGERVMIKGERIGWPLMELLELGVIRAGGIPDVYLVPPNNERGRVWSSAMGRTANETQLSSIPSWHGDRYRSMDKYIEVLGAEDPSAYSGLQPSQVAALASADTPFATVRLKKPWVITLFPTPGFARTEGMALEDYTAFIVKASTADPAALKEAETAIAPLFDQAETVTVETRHPETGRLLVLELNLEHSRAQLCYGLRNFPDGEVYTSPDARSSQGEIFIDLPVHYGGADIRGIHLKLEDGRIVEYSAQEGMEQLRGIIETDEGSHRLGEVALGMNPGLDKVLKHPLFVEKVGGTLHIAIGASYEDCYVADPSSSQGRDKLAELERAGILNRSAQHVDIVADFRPGGCGVGVKFDDRQVLVRDRIWVPA